MTPEALAVLTPCVSSVQQLMRRPRPCLVGLAGPNRLLSNSGSLRVLAPPITLNITLTPPPRIGPDHEPAVLRERQQYERLHGPLDSAKLAP